MERRRSGRRPIRVRQLPAALTFGDTPAYRLAARGPSFDNQHHTQPMPSLLLSGFRLNEPPYLAAGNALLCPLMCAIAAQAAVAPAVTPRR